MRTSSSTTSSDAPDGVLITLDVDWAPDFAIDFTGGLLVEAGARATWLATHGSDALDRVASRSDLFEVGIHPNFSPGSTHGETPQAVLAHCLELVPTATTVRTHSFVQSGPLLDLLLTESRLTADLSIFLPGAPNLAPVPYTLHSRTIHRLPTFWEDDYEFEQKLPSWNLAAHVDSIPGMKIFNFHPIHVYLNSGAPDAYAELKTRAPSLTQASESDARDLANDGVGARTLFTAIAAKLAVDGGGLRIRDLLESSG